MRGILFVALLPIMLSCKLGNKAQYSEKLEGDSRKVEMTTARQSAAGIKWVEAATKSLNHPTPISLPYKETGRFGQEEFRAIGYTFSAKKGEKIVITVDKKMENGKMLFTELYIPSTEHMKQQLLATMDSTRNSIEFEAPNEGTFLLRIQPEPAIDVEYSLTIRTEPGTKKQ